MSAAGLLLDPLAFPFMQRALVASVLVALVCAVVGAFVVGRGLAFVGDALAHASFAGIALALLLRKNTYLGALAAAVATTLAIAFVSRRGRVSADLASGVLFAGAFALGVVLVAPARNYTVDLFAFVFGNVLGIGPEDLAVIALVGVVVLGTVLALYKQLVLSAVDPTGAAVDGAQPWLLHYVLLALIGLTVVAAVKAVGIILVVALLVAPAATASLLTRRFDRLLPLAAGLATVAALVGLYVSFYANVPSGAATVLVSTGMFLIALALPGQRGAAARTAE